MYQTFPGTATQPQLITYNGVPSFVGARYFGNQDLVPEKTLVVNLLRGITVSPAAPDALQLVMTVQGLLAKLQPTTEPTKEKP